MNATTNGTGSTFRTQLERDVTAAGGPVAGDESEAGAIGRTTFDAPGSEDLGVTVLLNRERAQKAPAQALVRIRSKPDGRSYLGVVTAGPFAEPDGLRADSSLLVALGTHDGAFVPPFHGRVQVTILGEELADGSLTPPRLRPLPNSPVFVLDSRASEKLLKCDGDIRLGLAVGHDELVVGIPGAAKDVLPRHTAILGTTGGGKSTTVAGLIQQARDAGWAVVVLDVEGEYTRLHEPTTDPVMLKSLADRKQVPAGLPTNAMTVYHLVGRDTSNPNHPDRRPFSLQFARLSPYAAMEILDLSDPQQERFLKAYDIAKEVLRDLGIFPAKGNADQEQMALELDEFERGYPRLTLPFLIDVVVACAARADKSGSKSKSEDDEALPPTAQHPALRTDEGRKALSKRIHAAQPPGHAISWRALQGRLGRLNRLKVFYDEDRGTKPLQYPELVKPGRVSIIDLSDTGFSELNNLVIADLLRGLQECQDRACETAERAGPRPTPVLCIVEEAHEFLSDERIGKMPVLFREVAKIAKRGRKRWLGLAFVTQLPQHLPKQLLGLVNSFILHKITDPGVVSDLKKTVAGIDEGLWARLPGLAPGQALTSFPHFTRPLLVSIDPAAGELRMTS
jgi:uncharacterized protein